MPAGRHRVRTLISPRGLMLVVALVGSAVALGIGAIAIARLPSS